MKNQRSSKKIPKTSWDPYLGKDLTIQINKSHIHLVKSLSYYLKIDKQMQNLANALEK